MFAVEIRIFDEDAFADAMSGIREWLDHLRFEPSIFRYSFNSPGILLRVDFAAEAEAYKFAEAFGGEVVPMTGAPSAIDAAALR